MRHFSRTIAALILVGAAGSGVAQTASAQHSPRSRISVNDGWRHPAFRGYADHLATEEFADGLAEVLIGGGDNAHINADVVQAADDSGSTEHIIRTVGNSPAGSVWAIGTEVHLVNRLATELAPGRTVVSLDRFGCLCSTMFRVSPNHLLWILEELVEDRVHNRIVVPDDQKHWTRVALDRMLAIS